MHLEWCLSCSKFYMNVKFHQQTYKEKSTGSIFSWLVGHFPDAASGTGGSQWLGDLPALCDAQNHISPGLWTAVWVKWLGGGLCLGFYSLCHFQWPTPWPISRHRWFSWQLTGFLNIAHVAPIIWVRQLQHTAGKYKYVLTVYIVQG